MDVILCNDKGSGLNISAMPRGFFGNSVHH